LPGVSADLGRDDPRPGDRLATGTERRWHRGVLRSVADEAGLVLGLGRGTATRRIETAIELAGLFPATLAELSAGLINERTATTIAAELRPVTDAEARARVERDVLNWVADHGAIASPKSSVATPPRSPRSTTRRTTGAGSPSAARFSGARTQGPRNSPSPARRSSCRQY
jgi:hypothetical protein